MNGRGKSKLTNMKTYSSYLVCKGTACAERLAQYIHGTVSNIALQTLEARKLQYWYEFTDGERYFIDEEN